MQAKGRLQCWNADGQELGGSCREGCAGKGPGCNPGPAKAAARLGGSCRAHLKPARMLGGRFGGFEAWQTAALNAYKRSHCCGRVVLLSHCCGLVVAFACGSGACWACWGTFSLRSWPDFWRVWRVLEGLRPGKRQP